MIVAQTSAATVKQGLFAARVSCTVLMPPQADRRGHAALARPAPRPAAHCRPRAAGGRLLRCRLLRCCAAGGRLLRRWLTAFAFRAVACTIER